MQDKQHWYDAEAGFFGEFYQKGDTSIKGYLQGRSQTQKERTREEVTGIKRLLGLMTGSWVLDCPCGIGRHSIELNRRGVKVVAVDLNPDQLIVGEKKTKDKPASQRPIFCLGNMLNVTYCLGDQKVDAVINMFFSFGFFDTDEENAQVAKNFFDLLKPGGKFLMHTDVNMARIRNGRYKFNETRQLITGESLDIMERYNPRTKRIEGIWSIDDGKRRCEAKQYSVRVYENEEFVNLCRSVGFKDVKIYSDWNGSPYHEDAEMLIFVATK